MKRLLVLLVVTTSLLLATVAMAAAQEEELGGKVRSGDQITVPAGDTVDGDLYAFAGTVTIEGEVTGDVVAFGGQVDIPGRVGGDVLVAAGIVDLSGVVEGDARVSGGTISVSGDVGEDLFLAGGQATVTGDVGEDLVFGTGDMEVRGAVAGDVLGGTGEYRNTGTVGGSEDVRIEEPEVRERSLVARAVTTYVAVLLVGLLVGLLNRGHRLGVTIGMLRREAGPALLWGLAFLVVLVVTPVATLIMGTLLALVFGWLGLGPFVVAIVLSMIAIWAVTALVAFLLIAFLAPISVGSWLAGAVLPDTTPTFVAMAVGVAVLVALGLIPVAGPLIGLGVTVLGAGAWLRSLRRGVGEPVSGPPG
jgi:hypothetical protein